MCLDTSFTISQNSALIFVRVCVVPLSPPAHSHHTAHTPPTPQANCIDSTAEPTKVFAEEVKKLQADKLKPQEQLTLEPYERDHAVVVGVYR